MTPEGVEVPRSLVDEEMQKKLKSLPKECQPLTPTGPDPKWRYMWRVGPRPSTTRFQVLHSSFFSFQTTHSIFITAVDVHFITRS